MPARRSPNGNSTTIQFGRTAASAICRRPTTPSSAPRHRNGTRCCATLGAPRPAPLPHRAKEAQISDRLYLSLDEKWGPGQRLLDNLLLSTVLQRFERPDEPHDPEITRNQNPLNL